MFQLLLGLNVPLEPSDILQGATHLPLGHHSFQRGITFSTKASNCLLEASNRLLGPSHLL